MTLPFLVAKFPDLLSPYFLFVWRGQLNLINSILHYTHVIHINGRIEHLAIEMDLTVNIPTDGMAVPNSKMG